MAVIFFAIFLGTGCGTTAEPCGPSTCLSGCCDASGQCVWGTLQDACGSSGSACTVCGINQVCEQGLCYYATTSDGGTGGGSGGGSGGGAGGNPGGIAEATFEGSVSGNTLTVRDVTAKVNMDTSVYFYSLDIVIADVSGLCSNVGASYRLKDTRALTLTMVHYYVSADTVVYSFPLEGTYEVGALGSGQERTGASALFAMYDRVCRNTLLPGDASAVSGTITLTKAGYGNGDLVKGSYDLVIGSKADHIKGTFSAPMCGMFETTRTETCLP
ncbi:MAG: hypothetical protein K1X64_16340 [Myxococcaceae bacterium]|nr:hypothetical protein [Myxococcaceae bacterium]